MGCCNASQKYTVDTQPVEPLEPLEPAQPEKPIVKKDLSEFYATYTLGAKIGEGSFGRVHAAKRIDSHAKVAVKILPLVYFDEDGTPQMKSDKRLLQACLKEADIWNKIGQHQHCVQMHDAYVGNDLSYFVIEMCKCTMVEHLKDKVASDEEVSRICYQMLLGIEHLHDLRIVHRDIKPENFLIGRDKATVKLTDFGLSQELPKKGKLKGHYGTAPYMSPEMLSYSGLYSEGTDIWSFGATAYVIMFGDFPYMPRVMNSKCMKKAIVDDNPQPRFMGPESAWKPPGMAVNFVKSLLVRDLSSRPTAKRALLHPFVTVATSPKAGEPITPGVDRAKLAGFMSRARENSKQFKHNVDPTVQKSLEQLLQQLAGSNEFVLTRSFSNDKVDSEMHNKSKKSRDKFSTHDGCSTLTENSGLFSPTSSINSDVFSPMSSMGEEQDTESKCFGREPELKVSANESTMPALR
eukprot:gnl/TRDRNA2_/TRDRNA2_172614_c3_seq8.p1 gnl/TRDRNA2_/TRDRNA2_172614_c3~~gnl/TRDRNA2_/TRDRNA2_172614_c3_seq8.p1  ORF type:complete len:464 (-),score=88.07 gnl/TRDRNA2_/TRDRNA2_172614_c3_seq8:79-1470(-)